MYKFFIYSFPPARGVGSQPFTVVFCPDTEIDWEELLEELKEFHESPFPSFPETTLFVGLMSCKAALDSVLSVHAGDITPFTGNIHSVWYTPLGNFEVSPGVTLDVPKLLQTGIERILENRNPVIETKEPFHYVIPSGKHTARFLRTANLLQRGAEVSFLAYCLLQHVDAPLKHIYTDTAAIHALAYALVALRRSVDPTFPTPTIETFRSYDGVDSFTFHAKENSLYLISVSSGGLVQKLLDKGMPPDRIVTLLSVGTRPDDGTRNLHSLSRPQEVHAWDAFPASNCPLCADGLLPISIIGDQMIPAEPNAIPVLLKKEHTPPWLDRVLQRLLQKDALQCHRRSSPNREPIEVYLDLEPLLASPTGDGSGGGESTFLVELDRLLAQLIPASLDTIVYANDTPSCRALAKRAERVFNANIPARSVRVLSAEALESGQTNDATSVFVVADTVITGRALIGISRSLRIQRVNRQIHYFVAIARTPNRKTLEEIRSNLRFGGYAFNQYLTIYLPDNNTRFRRSPWSDETRFLNQIAQTLDDVQKVSILNERLMLLRIASDGSGFADGLFWPTSSGARLQLRPDFAFWEGIRYEPHMVKQSEVYVTVAAVLHNARHADDTNRWIQHEHHRTLVSPECFQRYNDGIIQASILRAAEYVELDYRVSRKASAAMRDLLRHTFRFMGTPTGEASIEFLLAISMKKLRLIPEHLKEAIQAIPNDHSDIVEMFRVSAEAVLSEET